MIQCTQSCKKYYRSQQENPAYREIVIELDPERRERQTKGTVAFMEAFFKGKIIDLQPLPAVSETDNTTFTVKEYIKALGIPFDEREGTLMGAGDFKAYGDVLVSPGSSQIDPESPLRMAIVTNPSLWQNRARSNQTYFSSGSLEELINPLAHDNWRTKELGFWLAIKELSRHKGVLISSSGPFSSSTEQRHIQASELEGGEKREFTGDFQVDLELENEFARAAWRNEIYTNTCFIDGKAIVVTLKDEKGQIVSFKNFDQYSAQTQANILLLMLNKPGGIECFWENITVGKYPVLQALIENGQIDQMFSSEMNIKIKPGVLDLIKGISPETFNRIPNDLLKPLSATEIKSYLENDSGGFTPSLYKARKLVTP
jgi:hypothetical protein